VFDAHRLRESDRLLSATRAQGAHGAATSREGEGMTETRDAEVELSWLRHRLGEVLEVEAGADVVAEVWRVVRERDDALSRLAAAQARGER
jgi:hypothetical protein